MWLFCLEMISLISENMTERNNNRPPHQYCIYLDMNEADSIIGIVGILYFDAESKLFVFFWGNVKVTIYFSTSFRPKERPLSREDKLDEGKIRERLKNTAQWKKETAQPTKPRVPMVTCTGLSQFSFLSCTPSAVQSK